MFCTLLCPWCPTWFSTLTLRKCMFCAVLTCLPVCHTGSAHDMPDFAREVLWLWTISVHIARKTSWGNGIVEVCWVLLLVASPGPNSSYSHTTRGDSAKGSHEIYSGVLTTTWYKILTLCWQCCQWPWLIIIDDIIWMQGLMKLTLGNAPAQVESFWTASLPQYQWHAIINVNDIVNIVDAIDNDNDNNNTKNNRERCNHST